MIMKVVNIAWDIIQWLLKYKKAVVKIQLTNITKKGKRNGKKWNKMKNTPQNKYLKDLTIYKKNTQLLENNYKNIIPNILVWKNAQLQGGSLN